MFVFTTHAGPKNTLANLLDKSKINVSWARICFLRFLAYQINAKNLFIMKLVKA